MSKDALADLLDEDIPDFTGPVDTAEVDFFPSARDLSGPVTIAAPRGQMPSTGSRRGPPNSIPKPGGRRFDDPPLQVK